jgi:hypothetical protein
MGVVVALAAGAALLAACSPGSKEAASLAAGRDGTAAAEAAESIVVYHTPTCSCCKGYLEYLRTHGFAVESRVVDETASVRSRLGMPDLSPFMTG